MGRPPGYRQRGAERYQLPIGHGHAPSSCVLTSTDLTADYRAALIAVGGSKRRGGPPDDTLTIEGLPRLTTRIAARIQGFPDSWAFSGKNTAAYRQIGNALPPPVAHAVAAAVRAAMTGAHLVADAGPELAAQSA